jgi:hypothetical protein
VSAKGISRALHLTAAVTAVGLALPCSAALGMFAGGGGRTPLASAARRLGPAGEIRGRESHRAHAARRPSLATVRTVQRLFHVLGYPLGRERAGRFGVRTKGALSYFQRKYGLPVTGYPDPRTVAQMQAVAAVLRAAPSRNAPPPRDEVERLLGGVPIMGLGLACALGLGLLALTARRKDLLAEH